MREGVVDMACEDGVDARRGAAPQRLAAAQRVDGDPRMSWLQQGMMADQNPPGAFRSAGKPVERILEIIAG